MSTALAVFTDSTSAQSPPARRPLRGQGSADFLKLADRLTPAQVRVLQPGDSGSDVAELQTAWTGHRPTWIPITGVYDTRTTDAVA